MRTGRSRALSRRRWPWVLLATGLLLGLVARFLPVGEICSFLQFRYATDTAKVSHMVRLRQRDTGAELLLLGSAHYLHVDTHRYPLWELKAVIIGWRPDVVAVEIRPEAIKAGQWGEGPIEMPFCASVARGAGSTVIGMDDWSSGWDEREDAMVGNVLVQSGSARRILVVTGYSHLPGFVRRLRRHGYQATSWSRGDRAALLKTPVQRRYPPDLRGIYEQAVARARRGETLFGEDPDWMDRRAAFAATLPVGP